MEKIDLSGKWRLCQDDKPPITGHLPGCTYLDYMAEGMDDPFTGMNETAAAELAGHDYTYSRSFEVSADFLSRPHIDLEVSGPDTLCTITVNGLEAGRTDNINRCWRLDVKKLVKAGENEIAIKIENPYPWMTARQERDPLPSLMKTARGLSHLRKTPCHFGWDWGPKLPPAGVIGGIHLESYAARINDLRIIQHHAQGQTELEITASMSSVLDGSSLKGRIKALTPDGESIEYAMELSDASLTRRFRIDNPRLWWCNGLGEQPLYQIEVTVLVDGTIADSQKRQIGLRTIQLDTTPDEYGAKFRFVINGVPVFARGADWIPADSFITRAGREDIKFYIDSAKHANMNMLRVWGGGYYESEDFYDACDRNGILVWQDFIFACSAYPFYDSSFLENVRAEVADNVRRLRHRPSLALWCGNNENEFCAKLWKKNSKEKKSNLPFYHETLREWVRELDGITPYWPGSPSPGGMEHKLQSMKAGEIRGDSHLWQVWHGMRPIEGFREFPTRFCSEYGMESMPSMHTIRKFAGEPLPGLFDPLMQLHQKSHGGNEKMLFYLLAKYRNPAKLEDFVYLSQLVQADTVRFAADCWRRNIGRSNGALFWQLNDCWPVASWSAIDYYKQLKAVMYKARHFNKMLCLSNDYYKDRAELYVVNEYPTTFSGTLKWTLSDFTGNQISEGQVPITIPACASMRGAVLNYAGILNGRRKEEAALRVTLLAGNQAVDEKDWLLVPDKYAKLPLVSPEIKCVKKDNSAAVTLYSPVYARHVYLEAEGVTSPWSDNFFDIPAGNSYTVTVELPPEMDIEKFKALLKVKTLTCVEAKNTVVKDKLLRLLMVLKKKNFLTWLIFRFFM